MVILLLAGYIFDCLRWAFVFIWLSSVRRGCRSLEGMQMREEGGEGATFQWKKTPAKVGKERGREGTAVGI